MARRLRRLPTRRSRRHLEGYRKHRARLVDLVGKRDPFTLTAGDCQEMVAALASEMKPASVNKLWTTFRLVLDFANLEPSPARDRKVKLPSIIREEPVPPTGAQLLALLSVMQ